MSDEPGVDGAVDEWLVEESGFDLGRAGFHETVFTVGNGRLGTRGSLEEGHRGQLSGTFLNGVYDGHDVPVIDLVNAPDWLDTAVFAGGVRLDVDTCTVVAHRRTLDLRDGLLHRTTVFEDGEGRRTRLETVRCASMADRRICALRVEVTPENHSAEIRVATGIDGDRRNLERLPLYPADTMFAAETRWEKWARARHLRESSRSADDALYLEMRTIGTGIDLGYAAATTFDPPPLRRSVRQRSERITEETVHRGARGRPSGWTSWWRSARRETPRAPRPGHRTTAAGRCWPSIRERAGSTRSSPGAALCGSGCGTSATARSSAMRATPGLCASASTSC